MTTGVASKQIGAGVVVTSACSIHQPSKRSYAPVPAIFVREATAEVVAVVILMLE